MPHLKELPIPNDYLAIFARGRSAMMMRREEAGEIRSKCFTFGINNYAVMSPHVLVWMDKVLHEIDRKGWPKTSLWVTRELGIPKAWLPWWIFYLTLTKKDYWETARYIR